MQPIEPHPDTAQDLHHLKSINRGSKQAIEDQAMNAMWDAIEEGKTRGEAERVFNDTYKKVLYGK